jgi:hypothetical protein
MSSIIVTPRPAAPPAGPLTTRSRRWTTAGVLVTGAALQVVEFLLERAPDDPAQRVAWWVEHQDRTAAAMSCGLLAVPFLLWGFAAVLSLTVRESGRLSVAAGALLTLAMVGLAGVHGVEMTGFALAASGDTAAAVSVMAVTQPVAPLVVLLVIFLGGAVLGTLTLATAIWRSSALPRVAALGVVAFAVLDFAVSSSLVSHVVALANSGVLAWAVVSGRSQRGSGASQ